MGHLQILHLNKAGQPMAWINREEAAVLYAKDRVLWELGSDNSLIMGGVNRHGERSKFEIAPIIATLGELSNRRFIPALSNRLLFRRDEYRCMYCGYQFAHDELSRDHIVPRAQGGPDRWENVVTACKRCNHAKADRTPEQAGMKLKAVPFAPNQFEFLYLANRNIQADQMDYLAVSFSTKRNWAKVA